MSTHCTRQDDRLLLVRRRADLGKHHFDSLVTEQLYAGAPVHAPAPILPEQRGGTNNEGMQEYTDLTRLPGGAALPLALLAQRTGTTTADAGSIHDAQAPIGFSALLLDTKHLVGWTTKRPIWLEREIVPREATSLPCGAYLWRSIARGWGRVWWWWW
jgi:hypothetical protein